MDFIIGLVIFGAMIAFSLFAFQIVLGIILTVLGVVFSLIVGFFSYIISLFKGE